MQADLNQGADDDAHHVAQEAAAADIDDDKLAFAPEVESGDLAHGGAGIAAGGAKGGKVVLADKEGGCGAHRCKVEVLTDMPCGAGESRGADRGGEDLVAVPFAASGEARMKVSRLLDRFAHGDVVGEEAIDPFAKGGEGEVIFGAEMGDHGAGMHAGIGAPGAVQHDLFANDLAEGFFDKLLDRAALGLALPADIGGAVVFDGEADRSHSGGRIINPRSPCPEKSLVMPASFS